MRGWGLTDTTEGRLAVIAVVAGTLMILVAVGNLVAADVADDDADRVRAALRQELARLPDEVVVGYPATRGAVEDAAGAALGPRRGRVLGSAAD
ncbi:MAG TPA: hypothetical protein VFW63_09210, partial [Acidimicrobiales bacterium]|nr:hypothetical protein [Acidimicrobiales bacterium]